MLVLWLTGLSGAGKSTLGDALVDHLRSQGVGCVRLDGDDLREGLNQDLGFSPKDRTENLRRAAHVAKLMSKNGLIVVCSFITPMAHDRLMIGDILGDRYVEVFVRASLEECEKRDPKGLYKRARRGEIPQFTGISSPYEIPLDPHLVVDTVSLTVLEAVEQVAGEVHKRKA